MWVRSARHKSLCVAAYLLRRGARERWRLRGRAAAPKSTVPMSAVIVRENAPDRFLSGSVYEPLKHPLSFALSLL